MHIISDPERNIHRTELNHCVPLPHRHTLPLHGPRQGETEERLRSDVSHIARAPRAQLTHSLAPFLGSHSVTTPFLLPPAPPMYMCVCVQKNNVYI